MALIDMNVRSDDYASVAPSDYNESPCVYLTDAQCKALGITSPPRAGTVVMISAMAEVQSVTESVDDDDDDPDVRMTLCLTHMELQAPNASTNLYEENPDND